MKAKLAPGHRSIGAFAADLKKKRFGQNISEEFSSRVAESTRLIPVKDGFGGDLGALDRCIKI
jgi:hypothetical protein